jgi:hypothetical protein
MVGLCTRLAIERAGTETPHLQRGAPDFYPNKTNFDLNRRASPRPYLGEPGGESPPGYSTIADFMALVGALEAAALCRRHRPSHLPVR